MLGAEDLRIRTHLEGAIDLLRRAGTSHLGRAQRRARGRHIAELEAYTRGGRYPRNLARSGPRRPALIDPFGTRCALAHLVERSGEEELVARLSIGKNHARVRDLARDEALLAWLEEAGLSAAEAARIQPTYGVMLSPPECACQALRGIVVVGTVMESTDRPRKCEVRVDEVIATTDDDPRIEGTAPVVGTILEVEACKATVGVRLLVTGSNPNAVWQNPRFVDDADKVLFESCNLMGRGRPSEPKAVSLAELRFGDSVEPGLCPTALGKPFTRPIPSPLTPVPVAPPHPLLTLPTIDYFVAGGGVLFIGAAITVLIKRRRKR